MTIYEKIIIEATGCSEDEAEELEEIMRDHIFHGILGESTKEELRLGARQALAIREGMDVKDLDF